MPTHKNLIIIAVLVLTGCESNADRKALVEDCFFGQRECVADCRGYQGCVTACAAGSQACWININEESPREWQPADAFYDGCTDACSDEEFCRAACSHAQSVIAYASKRRLRKYGTTTVE